ncbi:MAG: hypothetical protein VX768_03310 [Planctomycetota bacterium]|nr:hypothetical protein [Planctomycetota bacterium]
MTAAKRLLPFLCIPIAGISIYVMLVTPKIPPWQIVVYTLVIAVPCSLILLWRPFDLFFGFAPPKARTEGPSNTLTQWDSVTPWIGWLLLAAMILVNHFARPPADF